MNRGSRKERRFEMKKINNLLHFMRRCDQKARAIKNRAGRISEPVQLQRKNGDFVILHPSTYGPDEWQLSRFDKYGPYSDSRGKTLQEVAVMALEEGFRKNMDAK